MGSNGPAWSRPTVSRDLSQIKKDTLRVLVLRDPLTWEVRPGAMTGLEWELLERFAKRQKLSIKAIPVGDPDSMLTMLQNGRGDIMAAQISPIGWAAPYVACTQPYRRVASTKAVTRMIGIAQTSGATFANSDTLLVSRWSPFLDSLGRLTVGDSAWVARITPETPQQLLDSVAIGRQNDILVSDACGSLEAKRLPLIQFKPRVGRSVPLVFGVRTNSEHLLHALDTWLALAREHDARIARRQPADRPGETGEGAEQDVGEDEVERPMLRDGAAAGAGRMDEADVRGSVEPRIVARGDDRDGIDVACDDPRAQALGGGDRQHAGAGSDVEDLLIPPPLAGEGGERQRAGCGFSQF